MSLIMFGEFENKSDEKAGSFITTEGRVVFVGGPGSGGGSGGGVSKVTINTTDLKKGDIVVGFNKTVEKSSVSKNEFGGDVVDVIFTDGNSWKTSGNFDTTVFRPIE